LARTLDATRLKPQRFQIFVRDSHVQLVAFGALLWVIFSGTSAFIYWDTRHSVFALDDPRMIIYLTNPDMPMWEKVFTGVSANRWRPVADFSNQMAATAFGNNYESWWTLNMFLLGALAALSAVLFLILSKSVVVSFGLGALVVASRFSQYQAITTTGLMEAIANLLFVALIVSVVLFFKHNKDSSLIASVIFFFLLILTHERYQLLFFALLFVVLTQPSFSNRRKLFWAVASLAPVIFLTSMKYFVFHIPLAVGTGSATEIGFSAHTAVEFTITGFADVLGVNLGPSYLAGLSFVAQSSYLQGLSLTIMVLTVVLGVAPVIETLRASSFHALFSGTRRYVLFGLVLGISLVIPIVITIRIEQRWVVGLYILVLATIAFFYRTQITNPPFGRLLGGTLVAVLVIGASFMNLQYRDALDSLFFRGHQVTVAKVLTVLKPAFTEASEGGGIIYVIDPAANLTYSAYLNELIQANTDLAPQVISVVDSREKIPLPAAKNPILELTPEGTLNRIR
jgi:hypothetical protein